MSKKPEVSRRDFIRGAAQVVAGAAVGTAAVQRTARADVYKSILPQTIIGANEKIRTGHIGLGGMGKRDLQFVMMRDDMQPIAICDLNPKHVEQGGQIVSQKYSAPSTHKYFEEIIANKDVDAVVVVTPDHWHTIPSIMAMEAGKDVFCEKPLSTTILEGQAAIEAVRRTKRVYQSGTFQRSGKHFQEVVHLVQSGHIGKVGRVETWNNDRAKMEGIGNKPDSAPPEWLDWDRFIGWTPKVPYNENRYIYNFRWFTDYSGGKITDWGAHLIDIALWAMGEDKKPKTVTAARGNFILQDNRTTPDTLEALWEFDDYILSFSNRAWSPDWRENSPGHGIIFHGTLGSLRVDRKGYEVYPFRENGGCEPLKLEGAMEGDMNVAHWENFAQCVRDRKDPISTVEGAHNTTSVCILGKCAYISGAKLHWNGAKQKFEGRDKGAIKIANEWAFRKYRNGWSLKAPHYKGWKA